MTPCEIWVEFDAAQAKWREQFERELSVEWYGLRMYFEAMSKQYLQPLKSYLEQNQRKRSMPSLGEQRAELAHIARSYGITIGPWTDVPIHHG